MRLAFLYRQASPHHQDIFMLLTFSFLSAMGFGKEFVGTPILLLGSLFILKHLSWRESPRVQLSFLKEVPEGVSLLSASRLFPQPPGTMLTVQFSHFTGPRGALLKGDPQRSPRVTEHLWEPWRIFLSPPIRTSVLSGGDAARNVGFTSIRYRNKQKWIGPWPLLASSILLLSLILTSL